MDLTCIHSTYTQACVHVKPAQASAQRLTQTSFWTLSLSSLPTTEPPMRFKLDCAFIREYHILEIVVQIRCSVLQALAFVSLALLQFLQDNCSKMKFSEVILDPSTNSTTISNFPNMSTLAKICRVIPIHTDDVERAFSQLKLTYLKCKSKC